MAKGTMKPDVNSRQTLVKACIKLTFLLRMSQPHLFNKGLELQCVKHWKLPLHCSKLSLGALHLENSCILQEHNRQVLHPVQCTPGSGTLFDVLSGELWQHCGCNVAKRCHLLWLLCRHHLGPCVEMHATGLFKSG